MSEAEHHQLSSSIRRMHNSGIQHFNKDQPGGLCGEQYWFEFHDRATAEKFQRDLVAFAMAWKPEGR